MTYLLDTNVLMALGWENHEHHGVVTRWLRGVSSFATCPMTQGGFVRISSNPALGYANTPAQAFRSLDSIVGDHRHTFWPDDLSYGGAEVRRELINSHAQVTDNYLAALAFHRKGRLATFDQGLAKAFAHEAPLVSLVK
jgi:uncharacterized protein